MTTRNRDLDVVVVGAGFAGLYLLHRLRGLGFSATVIESADDVGGTWYWNRYPGARCDIESIDYSYSFDPELETEWQWSETLRDAARDPALPAVTSPTSTTCAATSSSRPASSRPRWDDDASRWRVRTDRGDEIRCRFYVMATGCLSLPKTPDIDGRRALPRRGRTTPAAGRTRASTSPASAWPSSAPARRRSSRSRSSPQQAAELTVFQRTPNFSRPGPQRRRCRPRRRRRSTPTRPRTATRPGWSRGGVPMRVDAGAARSRCPTRSAWPSTRRRTQSGDLLALRRRLRRHRRRTPRPTRPCASSCATRSARSCDDPETAEALCPKDHSYGTKRPCLDTNYYETYNLPHVRLVDLRKDPIRDDHRDGHRHASTSRSSSTPSCSPPASTR